MPGTCHGVAFLWVWVLVLCTWWGVCVRGGVHVPLECVNAAVPRYPVSDGCPQELTPGH